MGEPKVDGVEHCLNGGRLHRAGYQRAKIPASIPDQNDLLGAGQKSGDFFLDRLGSDVMAGVENDQILEAADNAPVSVDVDFTLIAGMKPTVLEDASGFFRTIPVAGTNIRAVHDDLFIVGDLELDAGDGGADISGLDRQTRIVQRADSRSFRQTVSLQNGNTEHKEELLRLRSERGGTANQGAQMSSKANSDLSENKVPPQSEPHSIKRATPACVLVVPAVTSLRK